MRVTQHLLKFKQLLNLEVFAKKCHDVMVISLQLAERLLQFCNHVVNLRLLILELEPVS